MDRAVIETLNGNQIDVNETNFNCVIISQVIDYGSYPNILPLLQTKMDWTYFFAYQPVPLTFLREYSKNVDWEFMTNLITVMPLYQLRRYFNYIKWETITAAGAGRWQVLYLINNYVTEAIGRLDWNGLLMSQVDEDIVFRCRDIIKWEELWPFLPENIKIRYDHCAHAGLASKQEVRRFIEEYF